MSCTSFQTDNTQLSKPNLDKIIPFDLEIKTNYTKMKKRSNITLLIICVLLVSIPILGFISLKRGNSGYPNIIQLFNNQRNYEDNATRFNIQVTYNTNGKEAKTTKDSVSH